MNIKKYKQVCFNTLKGNYTYTCHYDGTIIQINNLNGFADKVYNRW